MKISVLHATRGRPVQCIESKDKMLAAASSPDEIEYIFAVDDDDRGTLDSTIGHNRVVVDTSIGLKGGNRAYNLAAENSHGDLLILTADDMVFPKDWDTKLAASLSGRMNEPLGIFLEIVGPKHCAVGVQCLTRPWYKELGYVFNPEYPTVYSDVDLYWTARQTGKLVELKGFGVVHNHPYMDKSIPMDDTYRHENSPKNYQIGMAIMNRRWPGALEQIAKEVTMLSDDGKKKVYFCFLPERCIYDMSFDVAMSIMHRATKQGFLPLKVRYMRTDVARNAVCLRFLEHSKNPTDTLVMLDIDHDHPHDIVEHLAGRDLPVVVPLMFMRGEPYSCCAFRRDEKGGIHAIAEFPDNVEYVEVGGVGSGAIAIQRQALLKLREAGHRYFFQYEYLPDGRTPSEDLYFSKICHEAGVKMYVDMQIETPHIALGLVDLSTHLDYAADHPKDVSAEKMRVSMKGNGKHEDLVNRSEKSEV